MTTAFFLMPLNLWAAAAPQGQCLMHTKSLLRVHWLNQKQDFYFIFFILFLNFTKLY